MSESGSRGTPKVLEGLIRDAFALIVGIVVGMSVLAFAARTILALTPMHHYTSPLYATLSVAALLLSGGAAVLAARATSRRFPRS